MRHEINIPMFNWIPTDLVAKQPARRPSVTATEAQKSANTTVGESAQEKKKIKAADERVGGQTDQESEKSGIET